ncbi:hypothetical protein HHK36_028637 [Tetracentron sinense]|uniref:Uncharacterized protein n=1 Tax=Tetracentron sinense TaxID=13715 RepID=A0A834YBF0_TETSI|nr:hypothetical protein HHK36_028637 [Tetracentron sinense]
MKAKRYTTPKNKKKEKKVLLLLLIIQKKPSHGPLSLSSVAAVAKDASQEALRGRTTEPTQVHLWSCDHDDRPRFTRRILDVPEQTCSLIFFLLQTDVVLVPWRRLRISSSACYCAVAKSQQSTQFQQSTIPTVMATDRQWMAGLSAYVACFGSAFALTLLLIIIPWRLATEL